MESSGGDESYSNELTTSYNQISLLHDLQKLVNDRETADVVCLVGENQTPFYAHKLLLWARCSAFRKYQLQFWKSRTNPGPLTFKYPQYKPHVFSTVLKYIYTGTLEFEEPSVFSTLVLARDLGVSELLKQCERYVGSRLSQENVCLFLTAALQLPDQPDQQPVDKEEDSFVTTCYSYICRHASLCVTSPGWLRLPKMAVIKLISSQQFALEEDQVWRAVFAWARFQADVPLLTKPTSWSHQERHRVADESVSQCLSGITEHIKLLLIDSTLFAEEVEPCGIVAMETSLERYRLAALPDKLMDPEITDQRLKPRVVQTCFHNTSILTNDKLRFQHLLNQWFGKPKQDWRLLYRASEHAFSAETFHEKCDGIAPTYVIVKGAGGSICGGFSDVPWCSDTPVQGRFIPSHRAFLFTLVNNQGVAATQFDVVNSSLATLHHPEFGPAFGAGCDLCLCDSCDCDMESYSNLPHSYDGPHASSSILMGDYNFTVQEYEVFSTSG